MITGKEPEFNQDGNIVLDLSDYSDDVRSFYQPLINGLTSEEPDKRIKVTDAKESLEQHRNSKLLVSKQEGALESKPDPAPGSSNSLMSAP